MSNSISSMNRAQLYRQAQQNAVELGYNLQPLRDKWRRSTADYWRGPITKMRRNITNRDRRYNKALEINRQSRYPLSMPDKQGTDYKTWNREVRRLQMRVRRKPPTHPTSVLEQVRQRPEQMRVHSRTNTFKNELIDKQATIYQRCSQQHQWFCQSNIYTHCITKHEVEAQRK